VYDIADFDVDITFADPSQSLVIAAAAIADGTHYTLTSARTFTFSASPDYLISSTTVGTVTLSSYYFSADFRAGEALLAQVAIGMETFSTLYAPFPYPSLSMVEAVYVPGGMEYSGMFFLSQEFYTGFDGTAFNNLTSLGVHESFHSWWFGLVGNDQANEPWLDEALCLYSEAVFYEKNYPDHVNWWWNWRVNYFSPTGWVDTTIYSGGSFRPYTNAVYLRGADFLYDLRVRIGDEAFFAFLRDYATQMSWKIATTADFFTILRQHTDVDFSDLVTKYFQNPH